MHNTAPDSRSRQPRDVIIRLTTESTNFARCSTSYYLSPVASAMRVRVTLLCANKRASASHFRVEKERRFSCQAGSIRGARMFLNGKNPHFIPFHLVELCVSNAPNSGPAYAVSYLGRCAVFLHLFLFLKKPLPVLQEGAVIKTSLFQKSKCDSTTIACILWSKSAQPIGV
jgi:hypothetical protein